MYEQDVVREYGPSQGLDDLANLKEDISNLQFYNEQDLGNVQIDWFDMNRSGDNSGWLSDEPDVDERLQPKLEQLETGTATRAGMADDKGKLPESTGTKNFALELSSVNTADTEQEAANGTGQLFVSCWRNMVKEEHIGCHGTRRDGTKEPKTTLCKSSTLLLLFSHDRCRLPVLERDRL